MRGHGLSLIELEALHLAATESRPQAQASLGRARELAEQVDPLIGEVILAHIDKIAGGASSSDVSEPEVRLPSELGLWTPLLGSSIVQNCATGSQLSARRSPIRGARARSRSTR